MRDQAAARTVAAWILLGPVTDLLDLEENTNNIGNLG